MRRRSRESPSRRPYPVEPSPNALLSASRSGASSSSVVAVASTSAALTSAAAAANASASPVTRAGTVSTSARWRAVWVSVASRRARPMWPSDARAAASASGSYALALEDLSDGRGRRRPKRDQAAPGQDRRRKVGRGRRAQQPDRPGRRLLDGFEQRVGRLFRRTGQRPRTSTTRHPPCTVRLQPSARAGWSAAPRMTGRRGG